MEICKDDGEDSEVDTYNECYVCKKYREQQNTGSEETDLEETIPPEEQ